MEIEKLLINGQVHHIGQLMISLMDVPLNALQL
jgi:hypothetical protein